MSGLFFLVLMVICGVVLFLTSPGYTALKGCGCVRRMPQDTKVIPNTTRWIYLVAGGVIFHSVLLFSFVYPLYLHRKKMLRVGGNDRQSVFNDVKRATIAEIVNVTSDVAAFMTLVKLNSLTVFVHHCVFSVNLLINLTANIMSFANWKDRLFPFFKNLHHVKGSNSEPNQIQATSSYTSQNVRS